MTIKACILKAYRASKDTKPAEQFRFAFDNQLAIALQEGLDIKLRQRQIQELNNRIWYTTNLLKPTLKKSAGKWLKLVAKITEKWLLENTPEYKPREIPFSKEFDVRRLSETLKTP